MNDRKGEQKAGQDPRQGKAEEPEDSKPEPGVSKDQWAGGQVGWGVSGKGSVSWREGGCHVVKWHRNRSLRSPEPQSKCKGPVMWKSGREVLS